MKKIYYILFVLLGILLPACSSDDEPSSNSTAMSIQQYKWVCRTSDEPLVDDDYQWAIFDDYVITLYFVSDYECVIRYYRKHFDTDDGTSYTRDSQTVKYTTQGKNIILDYRITPRLNLYMVASSCLARISYMRKRKSHIQIESG